MVGNDSEAISSDRKAYRGGGAEQIGYDSSAFVAGRRAAPTLLEGLALWPVPGKVTDRPAIRGPTRLLILNDRC